MLVASLLAAAEIAEGRRRRNGKPTERQECGVRRAFQVDRLQQDYLQCFPKRSYAEILSDLGDWRQDHGRRANRKGANFRTK